jgi:hypothetical protein
MFLLSKTTNTLLEVLSPQELFDPFVREINGCSHAGEELQDPGLYPKVELLFPSGEALPRCWVDPHYRETAKTPTKQLDSCSAELEMVGCGCA